MPRLATGVKYCASISPRISCSVKFLEPTVVPANRGRHPESTRAMPAMNCLRSMVYSNGFLLIPNPAERERDPYRYGNFHFLKTGSRPPSISCPMSETMLIGIPLPLCGIRDCEKSMANSGQHSLQQPEHQVSSERHRRRR